MTEHLFINRELELAQLEHLYASSRAELFVLYGRRRVGKTELLRAFCAGKPHIFFIATLSSDSDQLAAFSQQVWGFDHPTVLENFTFPSWEAAFNALVDLPGRPIIILDEFTYLISGNKAIPSILQKVWDGVLKSGQVLLILCGSYIGMIEDEVLSYHAPLYGRRTASLLLPPLGLPALPHFFPGYAPEERFQVWGILGGMPYYLSIFSDQVDLETNIRQHILDTQGTLFNEPRLLLMEELREPRNYFSILRAIAQGHTRLNAIAQASGVGPVTVASRYLDILQQMRLVTRQVPVTERQPEKSRKGIYKIEDHFLRFWFRYVHPNLNSLDLGLAQAVLEQRIRPNLDHLMAVAFEEASRDYIVRLARDGRLPFLPERVGGWWDRDAEIDVMAIGERDRVALVGECKWSQNLVGTNILHDLKHKVGQLSQVADEQKVIYYLFARSGFTADLKAVAEQEGVHLVSLSDGAFAV